MTLSQQQARIKNIDYAESANAAYLRRIRIRDYLSGQAIYNLGDYPHRISAEPTDYDRELIKKMAQSGVRLIQLHEEWNDPLRLHGADKFNAPDREGMKHFVELCHSCGIKIIAYASSGYFQVTDPDWRTDFSFTNRHWDFNCYSYTKGSHGSAFWRDYVIPRTLAVMDNYGFDGIYNDWGYDNWDAVKMNGDCSISRDSYDPQAEDMLAQIYSEVKRRGGIYKLHCDRNNAPPCRDKVYDYLWIGECVTGASCGIGKDYEPYVVPCLDLRYTEGMTHERYYAYTVPFMQFPLMKTGRPIMGKNVDLPGITYYGGDEQRFYRSVGEYMDKHPDGPYVYSLWSGIPDDPDEFDTWAKYYALYAPMVSENSLAYIELRDCKAIKSAVPDRVYASMFVNEDMYLVVSNLSGEPYELVLDGMWKDRVSGRVSDRFMIDKEQLMFLVKQ